MKWLLYFIVIIPASAYPLFEPADCEGNIWTTQGVYISPAFIHNRFGISADYILPFGMTHLALERIAVVIPTGIGSFAFRASNFGNLIYRENEISVGYGKYYKSVRFGTFIKTLYVSTKEYGTAFTISGDIGVTAVLNVGSVWLSFRDFTSPNIGEETVGGNLMGGIYISPEDWFDIDVRIMKQQGFATSTKVFGLFHLSEFFTVRAGMNTSPRSFIVGTAFAIGNIGVTYVVATHQELGLSHVITVGFGR